ncbi:hypothetical protein cypCar_00029605 [Cyprinus carpio]|nr:hypothetical protein cypCar_00029605 [Cyprinus carpio]
MNPTLISTENVELRIDSVGAKTSDWFNGTVPVDQTVGTRTSFTITYETSLPNIYIMSPSGSIYDQMHMHHDESTKYAALKAVMPTYELPVYPATVKEIVYELSVCPATAKEAISELSACTVMAKEAIYELSACPSLQLHHGWRIHGLCLQPLRPGIHLCPSSHQLHLGSWLPHLPGSVGLLPPLSSTLVLCRSGSTAVFLILTCSSVA